MSGDRRFHTAAWGAMAAHQGVEVVAGSGVLGQARLGLAGSLAALGIANGAWFRMLRSQGRVAGPMLAAASGFSIAVPVVHFTLFPWRIRRGLPFLTDAEGLGPRALLAYNGILYACAVAGLAALILETRPRDRRWMLVALPGAPLLRAAAKEHLEWVQQEARRNPRWWNRAWQEPHRPGPRS